MKDRAQHWAIAFLAMLILFAAGKVFADSEKWQLQVIAIDAKTGEQLTEGALFTKAGLRSEFVTYKDCLGVLAEVGPIPAHDSIAPLVYCQKVEIQRIGI